MITKVRRDLRKFASREKARTLSVFFKTGKGQYGEGDKFLGITVPNTRKIAKQYIDLDYPCIKDLLRSSFHEERLLAVFILIAKFEKSSLKEKENIFKVYLRNLKYVNNWDLVDLSAPQILGAYLFHQKDKHILKKLAFDKNIWKRRVAVVSTLYFIKRGVFQKTLEISKILLADKEDLIHKAVGWMLREVGKKDEKRLVKFLKINYSKIPRTTLRYAIEKFSKKDREMFLKKSF